MSGIYVHIPFCRQACHYCDFHFSTNLSGQDQMIEAIQKELVQRRDHVIGTVHTVYFGGGTPSLLTNDQVKALLETINENYGISIDPEFTLEANPEDLSGDKLQQFKALGFNRLSIGIQTFSDSQLHQMNRTHNSGQAIDAFKLTREAGFDNISVDLIYALPFFETGYWEKNLETTVGLDPDHISLYGFTVEDNTVFGKQRSKGLLKEIDESMAASQYLYSISFLESQGYLQYEVSNFAKKGYRSRHNASYWMGEGYLGVGPGAHSYDGGSRRANIRNNARYLRAISGGGSYFEIEKLSVAQQMNELILTGLRTTEGINMELFKNRFNFDLWREHKDLINSLTDDGLIYITEYGFTLTPRGFLVTDEIALKFLFLEKP